MTQRERLQAVFNGEIPDAVPWFTDMSYYQHGNARAGTLPEKYLGQDGLLELHRDLGVGIYLFTPPLVKVNRDPTLFYRTEEDLGDGRRRYTIHTPEGNVSGLVQECPQSSSTANREYPVKSAEDLRVVRCWYEGATYKPNYDAVIECDRKWGDIGFGVPIIPRSPLAALVAEWVGVVNLSYIAADAPDALEEALEAMRRAEDGFYRLVCQAPYPVVEVGENLTAEAVGGLWRRYSRDYYKLRTNQLHASGKLVGCHIDGTLGRLLKDIVEVGIDFPESIVPRPVGDLTVREIRDAVGPETILWGGVPGAMFAPPFEPEWVREVVRVVGERGRFVLAGADQVPPNGDIGLVRRIGELVEEIGPPRRI